jgi:hypothetical protein
MCPVCMLTSAAMIVAGVASAGGVSTVAIWKSLSQLRVKKTKTGVKAESRRNGRPRNQELKVQENTR